MEEDMLFEKKLTNSDVARAQDRLMMSGKGEGVMAALTEEEREKVEREGGYLEVITHDEDGGKYKMRLTKWRAIKAVVLRHGWHKFVDAKQLKEGDTVQGWGYRTPDGRLRLDLKVLRDDGEANSDDEDNWNIDPTLPLF